MQTTKNAKQKSLSLLKSYLIYKFQMSYLSRSGTGIAWVINKYK